MAEQPVYSGISHRSEVTDSPSLSPAPQTRFSPFVKTTEEGLCQLTLGIENVHCANCIQKVESALARDGAVREGRVNFSTKRLNILWNGTPEKADELGALVESLGYPLTPFDAAGSAAKEDKEEKFLLLCMAVAGFASGNIMLLSVALWTTSIADMGFATRELFHWVSAFIAIPAALFSARPFFRSAWTVLSKGRTNMDVPISVGVCLTLIVSLMATIEGREHAYFDSVVMLVFFLLIGRYLDQRARQHARKAASDLLAMMAGTATIEMVDGTRKTIAIKDIKEDMIVHLAVGERVPADSIVLDGASSIDTSLVTGESLPQDVRAGDKLFSGTLNLAAPLKLRVAKAAEDSLLADIIRLMERAEQGQARYVRLADRAARLYTPVVHTLAALTFIGWMVFSAIGWQDALMIAATVLIITCPCALGLAVPVVQVLATGHLMKRGIMVKSGDAFERLSAIDTLLLDKTGTLTVGRPELQNAEAIPSETLRRAAALAHQSRHPLSQALVRAAPKGPVETLTVTEHPGQGLEAFANGQHFRLGSRAWCGDASAPQDTALELWFEASGARPVRFTFADSPRTDAAETLQALKARGLTLKLLSGDRDTVVQSFATEFGLTAQGAMKPDEKFAELERLRAQGHKIGMVGDGLNDAPVLAGADISLSPASAIDLAQNAADIVFMGDKLQPVVQVLDTARLAQKLVKQNFLLAIVYNAVAIPLAMAGHVTPLVAALAMSGSSIVVIANSFRVKK